MLFWEGKMLSEEEKKKIEEEERYKASIKRKIQEEEEQQKAAADADAALPGCIGCLTIIVGILLYFWIIY